jgi:outer membrane receptor protein involved in Fe transport
VSLKFTGDRFVNIDNTWVADSYVLADVYLGTDLEELGGVFSNMNVHLTVNNLFDEDYLGTIAQNAAWIGGKRTTVLAVTMDF